MSNKTFTSDNGEPITRSAFIKQEYLKGKGRNVIAEELGIPYYIVYGATVNMDNGLPPATGRSKKVVMIEQPDGTKINRDDLIVKDFEAGMARKDIAEKYDVAYGTVYAVTKDLGVGNTRAKSIVDPRTGEIRARADVIKELFAQCGKRREVANLLGVDYAVVWASTKPAEGEDALVEE